MGLEYVWALRRCFTSHLSLSMVTLPVMAMTALPLMAVVALPVVVMPVMPVQSMRRRMDLIADVPKFHSHLYRIRHLVMHARVGMLPVMVRPFPFPVSLPGLALPALPLPFLARCSHLALGDREAAH